MTAPPGASGAETGAPVQPGPAVLAAVGLLAGATLAYEVLLTRLLSIVQWYHFAYLVVSVALLGFGVAGVVLVAARRLAGPAFPTAFALAAAGFGITAAAGFAIAERVPFNALALAWDARQLAALAAIEIALTVPFALAATGAGLALMRFGPRIPAVYAADLVGAAAGAAACALALTAVAPERLLELVAAAGALAGVLAAARRPRVAAPVALVALALATGLPDRAVALRMSQFKPLAQALQAAGARVVERRSGPLGVVQAVENERVPLRAAPGLSVLATQVPPEQIGLYVDGDGPVPVVGNRAGDPRLGYLAEMPGALAYTLRPRASALVLHAAGGAGVLQALRLGAASVDAVEPDANLTGIVRDRYAEFSGGVLDDPAVRLYTVHARDFVARTRQRYDVVVLDDLGALTAGAAGMRSLQPSWDLTVEAVAAYLDHLRPGGLLVLGRWLRVPPRDGVKLFATAVRALRGRGVADPGRRLLWLRGAATTTLLVKNGDFVPAEIEAARAFARRLGFDLAFHAGMPATEANRRNRLPEPYFHQAAVALLSQDAAAFLAGYPFAVEPATDDRPYFDRFFRWSHLRAGLADAPAFVERGSLVLLATLAQSVLATLVLVLLPLALLRREALTRDAHRAAVVGYFAAIGIAFMLVEIAFIEKLTVVLHSPVAAIAVSLAGFLLFAGLGSACAQRRIGRHGPARLLAAIVALVAGYAIALPLVLGVLAAVAPAARIATSLVLLAPLAFVMGMPMPVVLAALHARAPALVPWAWGVNGCASVVAAVVAVVLAQHIGFTGVLWCAALGYAAALAVVRRAAS